MRVRISAYREGGRHHRLDDEASPHARQWRGPWGAVPRWTADTLWCLGYRALAVRRSQEALALAQALAHPYSLAPPSSMRFTCIIAAASHRRSRCRLTPLGNG